MERGLGRSLERRAAPKGAPSGDKREEPRRRRSGALRHRFAGSRETGLALEAGCPDRDVLTLAVRRRRLEVLVQSLVLPGPRGRAGHWWNSKLPGSASMARA